MTHDEQVRAADRGEIAGWLERWAQEANDNPDRQYLLREIARMLRLRGGAPVGAGLTVSKNT